MSPCPSINLYVVTATTVLAPPTRRAVRPQRRTSTTLGVEYLRTSDTSSGPFKKRKSHYRHDLIKKILVNNSEKAKRRGCVEKEFEAQGNSLGAEKYDSAVKKWWAGISI